MSKSKLKFKEVATIHWESEDGRFIIQNTIPKGFCAKDTWYYFDEYDDYDYEHTFKDTMEEAVAWCENRVY